MKYQLHGGVGMKKRSILVFSIVLVLVLTAAIAYAGSVKGWGEQTRGSAGMNAQLKGEPFTVPNGVVGTITSVNCSGDGFWIQGAARLGFNPASRANGATLRAGTYYVYPNLKHGQNKASVNITVSW